MNHARAVRATLSLAMLILLSVAPVASSQDDSDTTPPASSDAVTLTDAQLQTLVAPIALYPDPLIAQILPASTYPTQVVLAARWLQANPNPSEASIDAQNMEPSVKAMLHYPTVLEMMNTQLDWTQSLGVAFINQQSDVMNAIQEMRRQAQSDGALKTTPQQQVVTDDDDIDILPVDPNVVYVPEYDPLTVYEGDGGYLSFGAGFPEGLWLDNNVDWHHRWVEGGHGWNHGWDKHDDDRHDGHDIRPGGDRPNTKPWTRNSAQPLPVRARPPVQETARRVAPGYEDTKARAPAPAAFNGYQNHAVVQRDVNRAQESRPAPEARSAPAAPAPRAAPAQAFHAEGDGRTVAAQSARGNESRSASTGGGGGGARSGGGGGGGGRSGGGGGHR